MTGWLDDAVFYEIYPQTYRDSNGDGIGDIRGIIEKLDYIKGLGCNALWINPCFDSPFKDAGYDVRDYRKVAPRYGTNEDLFTLFDEAHRRGIRVMLDLVPGHTSEEHSWFAESRMMDPGDEFRNRYIWTDGWFCWLIDGLKFIAGEAERDGCYIINFFKCQPALNYGFLERREKWQLPPDHPDCIATREALKDIMRFWLAGDRGRGCDGFRVDMADSLVKFDDDSKSATSAVWRNVREMLDAEFPDAALVSEWGCPPLAIKAGFHADFLLDHGNSGYRSLVRDYADGNGDNSYFRKDGNGDITRFLAQYMPWYEATKNAGHISLITG
ncbi:MAG: alpha-amylase family glycosyl hydrolase, partial [Treponema sp.]|nr:alpha-amylase family glycosyl hydrolase [Treponema sp.]